MSAKDTSWNKVARWYDEAVEGEDSYQKDLILPNVLRILEIGSGSTSSPAKLKPREMVLDLACGQGFFSRALAQAGARVVGVDIAENLIKLAKKKGGQNISYYITPADKLDFLEDKSIDKIIIILALQNIENVQAVFKECGRVMKDNGALLIVLNHPAFRIPKRSSWGWSEAEKIQYRRVDAYLSESAEKIQMHPGDNPGESTLSFHRPLQFYFKALEKAGLCVTHLEEWNSNKKSEPGLRAKAENQARKEIPLFLFIKAEKC